MSKLNWLSVAITLALFPIVSSAKPEKSETPDPVSGLEYRLIGPKVNGRMTRVGGVSDGKTFYAAAAQGGLWKSTNNGRDWDPIFDDQETQSIGSFAIAPSDPNVIYVGSGEANIRGNVALGYGIWKSTDAGKSFEQVLKLKGQIGTMVVHPSNPDVAYAAVLGSPFASGAERGVYRTKDGGKSWQKILYINADTGASDVAMDATNPRKLFAGFWQTRRTPWGLTSGGPGSALQASNDGGETWTDLNEDAGLPAKPWGRVGVGVAPSDSSRVYALIEAKKGGLFRSDDGGESFTRISDHRVLRQRAWYYNTFNIHPTNKDIVYFPQVGLVRTFDGGKTLVRVPNTGHGDHHDVWIDPKDPNRILEGNDGGVGISVDAGSNWQHPDLPLAQFYNIDVDNRTPYHVGGTMQDMGTASGPSAVLRDSGANLSDWRIVGGGEAGDFVYDKKSPGEIYAGEYGGYLSHFSETTGQTRSIAPYPTNVSGIPAKEQKYRFQWTSPTLVSLTDNALYHGGNVLFKSTDKGHSWTPISPDLTRNDPNKQGWSGGPITGDITGAEYYNTIFSLAESSDGALYAGTDDGRLHRTDNGGKNWTEITPKGLPEWATIEGLHVPSGNNDSIYVVAHNYRLGDDAPYLYRSNNRGQSYERLSKGLPNDLTLWAVRVDPEDANYIYLGTQRGVWYSKNAGASFEELALNLPKTTVTDLETKHGDLIVATRGRSIWALENLSALRAANRINTEKLAFLPSKSATRFMTDSRWGDGGPSSTDNPGYGINGHYWIAEDAAAEKAAEKKKERISLSIYDASGVLVRKLTNIVKPAQYAEDDPDEPTSAPEADLSTDAGLNSFNWDLRATGAKGLRGAKLDFGDAEAGPTVPPGEYTLKLAFRGQTAESKVSVLADPRSPATAADLRADYEFGRGLIGEIDRARFVIEALRALRGQLDAQLVALRKTRSADSNKVARAREAGLALGKRLAQIEANAHNPNAKVVYDVLAGRDGGAKLYHQLVPLYWLAQSADDAPNAALIEQRRVMVERLVALEASYQDLKAKELASYKTALDALGGVIAP
jgi:photosystem II stability/assembly factor-like uncharacterized protein